jgi:glucose/arabinose dehydrogenase
MKLQTTVALMALAAWPAVAQQQPAQPAPNALETLGAMRPTNSPIDWPEVPQTGQKADQVKQNLAKVKLPQGFHISLYALVPDARHIAVGPQGVATFVGTRKSKIWVVTDRARGGVADEVKEFAPTLPKKIPNGACFSKDGFLYIPEQNRVLEYPAAEFFYESPDVVASVVVPEGELIPKSEESYNHTARVCRVGPDNKLYIQLGQPYNVPAKDKLDLPQARHRRDYPHGSRRQEPRSLCGRCAIPSAWISTRRTSHSGPTTIRSTAWGTISRRAK